MDSWTPRSSVASSWTSSTTTQRTAKMFFHPLSNQYRLKSLRRCDQHVGRTLGLLRPSTSRRVPVTHLNLHIKVTPHLLQSSQQVTVQRAEWRYVEDRDAMCLLRR